MKFLTTLSLVIVCCTTVSAKSPDWLINPSPYSSTVVQEGENLVMTNALVSRTFLLGEVGTTIGFNNLVTDEEILRSVRPEAEITIDGVTIPVGGMDGQPIHNYLLPTWLKDMNPNPEAMKFAGYTVTDIATRFDWKPRAEWMATHPAWPPKGKEVTLSFRMSDQIIKTLVAKHASDANRDVLLDEKFTTLSPTYKVMVSGSNSENLFSNEGKVGEILVPANTAAYAEVQPPADAQVIVVRIHPGTDKSATWGPGLVWGFDKGNVKFNLRTAEGKFCLMGGGLEFEFMKEGIRLDRAVDLRMQRTGGVVICSYSYDDGATWTSLYEVPLSASAQSKYVRVGKTDWGSSNGEHGDKGTHGRCRIEELRILGAYNNADKSSDFDYLKGLEVNVHYEIYDGMPLICKWISVTNNSDRAITINRYKSEILAAKEVENDTYTNYRFSTPNITVETDFEHAAKGNPQFPDRQAATMNHSAWTVDPMYKTQIDWSLRNPCLLISAPQYGPEQKLNTSERFESHRTWELIHDSWDRERKSLQVRKMYRKVAPWTAENPIFMHVRSADNESVKKAIDQCAEVGFEMVIMTFWSGIDIENPAPENLERMKMLAEYAHSKGIALGGYSLLASRSIDKKNDVIMPEGFTPTFGSSPCLESEWGRKYFDNLYTYYKTTGQDILEHDGSYPGDECASTEHPGHTGLGDSQWKQFKKIQTFYHWCKSQGIFLNIPDWYFMNGGNKTGMGYRETNWSLPREQQEVLERQNIYDGTWRKTPSMGWMMVPLVEYHGGGEEATIEPLNEHLDHYGMRLANNFGAGVIACYRGPQLYDTPTTRDVVKYWVDFYKTNRAILNADVIHLRRPDGMDWDGMLHADPQATTKGLAMIYNPLDTEITREITLPLYYTGLSDAASITIGDGKPHKYKLDRDYAVKVSITIPAKAAMPVYIR